MQEAVNQENNKDRLSKRQSDFFPCSYLYFTKPEEMTGQPLAFSKYIKMNNLQ